MKCEHCDTRDSELFMWRGFGFCCECMAMLCSWLLDGGWVAEPEMFDYVVDPATLVLTRKGTDG